MNRKKTLRLTIALIFLQVWLGCASNKATLKVMSPAEVNIQGIRRLAVLDFRGPEHSGQAVASKLITKLWESNFYTLVERSELQQILDEHALSVNGMVDVTTAVEAGKLLGVDAIVLGEVIQYQVEDTREFRKVKKKVWTGEYERDAEGNIIYEKTLFGGKVKKKKYKEVLVTEEVVTRDGTVTIGWRLVDVRTGEIRAAKQVSHSYHRSAVTGEAKLPARGEVLNQLLDECVDDIVKMLVPHEVQVTVQFETGTEAVNRGIELAKSGLWDKAVAQWQTAVQANPGDPSGWYNLGIGYEALLQLDKAEKAFDRAVSLKPKKLYIQALKRVRERKTEMQRLQQQLQQR